MKQDHYKNLIMSAPVGYGWHKIVLDERGVPCDYVFLDVNPAFERLTGLSSSEILNRRVTEVLPGITDDEFDWIGKFGNIACHGGEMEFEQYSKPLDKWYRIQVGSSEKGFFSTVFVDITEMRSTEEEQNLLLDNINTQIWYLRDPEHNGKVNRAHADFMGLTEEKIEYQSLYDILGKDEADLCYEGNKKVFEEKKPVTTEEWVTNGQRERRLLRITRKPKLNHKEEVEFVVCSAEDITERRKEKQALRQSEEKFRKIFENAPLGFMHFNAEGIITECNDYLVSIIGSSQKAITGLNLLKLPDKGVVAATRRALEGELNSYEGYYESTTADKTTPVRALFAPLKLGSDVVAGGIGIIEDITERKKAEEELKVSERKMRSLIKGIDELIFVLDKDLRFLEFSQPVSRTMKRSRDEFLGKKLEDISFPDPARTEILRTLKSARDTGEFRNLEYYVDLPEGRYWFDMNINSARDSDGNRILIGVVRDTTRRKQMEEALRESETKYRQLFEDSPISLWEQDFSEVKWCIDELKKEPIRDFCSFFHNRPELVREFASKVKVLNVNKVTIRQYNASSKEEFLDGLWKVFNEESYEDFAKVLVLIAEDGNELTLEKKHVTLDGKLLDVYLHWSAVPGFETTYSRVITSVMDITERKKSEELVRSNLQEKNVLLSEIHHRVKNNMAVISSLLTLQPEINGMDTPDKVLRDTRTRVHSMALVHELVYETNNFAEIDFKYLLQRLIDNLDKVYRKQHQNIEVKISSDDILLELNQSIPCALLVNELITNAYLHAFEGRSHGKIEVLFHKKDDGYARLVVRDDGKGMVQPEILENPESFGYTIIHGLVRQIGGTIRMDSINSGLTIEVRFKPAKPFDTVSSGLSGSNGVS